MRQGESEKAIAPSTWSSDAWLGGWGSVPLRQVLRYSLDVDRTGAEKNLSGWNQAFGQRARSMHNQLVVELMQKESRDKRYVAQYLEEDSDDGATDTSSRSTRHVLGPTVSSLALDDRLQYRGLGEIPDQVVV